ncbi:MAG: glycosyltransferase [Planctomycetota bacterium]
MIGLGTALAGRGHEVEIVTNPHFESDVRNAGLGFVPVSTAEAYDELTQRRDLWKPLAGLQVVFRFGVVELLDDLYDAIEKRYRPGETVIGAHGLDLASRVLSESVGAPVVSVVYAPVALWSNRQPPRLPYGVRRPRTLAWLQFRLTEALLQRSEVMRSLQRLRDRVGLSRLSTRYFDWYYGVASPICLFPDWFAADPGDWPAQTVATGFPLWDDRAAELPTDVADFLAKDTPPIAFTPGSANRVAERFFAAAIDACQRLGRRGLLLTKYAEQLPASLPPDVLHAGFIPLGRVLPRCAAFVHHGGIGSSAQGLAAGVPQLIQPMGFDQMDNALRLRRLGVAAELKPARFTGERLAKSLATLLDDETVAGAAKTHAGRMDREASLRLACEALERRDPERHAEGSGVAERPTG